MKKLTKIAITASIGLALALMFSCSGADGTDGTSCIAEPKADSSGYDVLCGGKNVGELSHGINGTSGASCTIEPKVPATAGYDVLCGGEVVGTLVNGIDGAPGTNGAKGDPGESCTIATSASNSAYFQITCGSTTEQIAKAWCVEKAYDPAKMVCNNGILTFSFTDARDTKTYKAVVIGSQTWMAENLNYNAPSSKCYAEGVSGVSADSIAKNCAKYGRLYNWATAMALSADCNTSLCASQVTEKHRGICPSGWHIPSGADWNILMKVANPSCTDNSTCAGAGTKLKAKIGWNPSDGIPAGTDDFGFSALPGGSGYSDGSFYYVGNGGDWWSASGFNSFNAYDRYMDYNHESAFYDYYDKNCLFSVRCVQD